MPEFTVALQAIRAVGTGVPLIQKSVLI